MYPEKWQDRVVYLPACGSLGARAARARRVRRAAMPAASVVLLYAASDRLDLLGGVQRASSGGVRGEEFSLQQSSSSRF
jgi:hypothetical protein